MQHEATLTDPSLLHQQSHGANGTQQQAIVNVIGHMPAKVQLSMSMRSLRGQSCLRPTGKHIVPPRLPPPFSPYLADQTDE
ncbi:hypothetical protein CPLU01_07753 [Colletotrichum plurivorum]|uniref:Uncharacterized protein n=1 Tax=Colletotrichum plurivorum TaxID=2175906 RepID=A0A8H6KED6_9PEZI|nr:hypothetical protein CPLU01_07753 [Colletotrichum plurivorum]